MPYGTCNDNYKCDVCGCTLPKDSLAWVDLKPKKSILYCMKCKPDTSLKESKPKLTPSQKELIIMKIVLKNLREKNRKLREEVARLKKGSVTQKKGKHLFRHAV